MLFRSIVSEQNMFCISKLFVGFVIRLEKYGIRLHHLIVHLRATIYRAGIFIKSHIQTKYQFCCVGHIYIHVGTRSEENTSELQSLMRISYAVFCLKTKTEQ